MIHGVTFFFLFFTTRLPMPSMWLATRRTVSRLNSGSSTLWFASPVKYSAAGVSIFCRLHTTKEKIPETDLSDLALSEASLVYFHD